MRTPRGGRLGTPRGCGEQWTVPSHPSRSSGTPPRVRGAAGRRQPEQRRPGNTPAGAGSRPPAGSGHRRGWEHPRGCGEQARSVTLPAHRVGTPPRVRGAVLQSLEGLLPDGNTPAGAGSRRTPTSPSGTCREHPRGCGEQATGRRRSAAGTGTPPRVRGAGTHEHSREPGRGNTPAGAGSRVPRSDRSRRRREHPRGCGEQHFALDVARPAEGTPPRVRGADSTAQAIAGPFGNTPAGAGSRPSATSWEFCEREHPRGCGEQGGNG